MGSRNKTANKPEEQARREIIEDWANIRRWIDDLQQEWAERQRVTRPPERNKSRAEDL
ncbi:MAG: hypothetical protein R6U89_10255 [Dehalococcoidia bacterium]